MTLRLTIATGPYDRTAALRDGRVRIEGVETTWLPLKVEEIFWRMMQNLEFDASELSFSGYTVRKGRNVDDLVAIPVFLSRSFRHNIVYINADAGIETPQDLTGRKVGVPEYQMTAAVWLRGMFEDEHGVRPQDIEWWQGGLEQWGRKPFEPVAPDGVTINSTPEGTALAQLLATGEIDALISPRVPSTYRDGTGPVRRLFPQPAEAEKEYFGRTKIFPIMHTVAIKRGIVDENPWLPRSLMKAFEEAKNLAIRDLSDTTAHHITLPFLKTHVEETVDRMGEDFWPYGLEANRHTLETFLRYAHHQGLTAQLLSPEDLFPKSTWRSSKI
ncbi:MAG: ABC transporter substrate-binding protein [Acidimicrobiia bacterium]|nr:ABC transporter substrate-binding protein [Acidimicrobiia bacterium]